MKLTLDENSLLTPRQLVALAIIVTALTASSKKGLLTITDYID